MNKFVKLKNEIKTHWSTPAEGKYVPYREYKDIFLAVGSNQGSAKALGYIKFAASCYLIMYHYKLPYLVFSVISIINMPLGYIWSPINWYVSDNLGFLPKKSEKKIYTLYFLMIIFGLVLIITDFSSLLDASSRLVMYLNSLEGITASSTFKLIGTNLLLNGWSGARNIFWRKKLLPKYGRYKYSLYCDFIPKCVSVILIGWLPVYAINDVATRVWCANLLFGIFGIFEFTNKLEDCCKNISPNARERILVRTYPVKISHFSNTLIDLVFPIAVGFLNGKWENINLFRYIIPGTFIVFSTITMIFSGRIKERIPQPPIEKKVQISFWDGIFGVMKNKYRWIDTIVDLLDSLGNGMLAFTTVVYLYTFRLSGVLYSVVTLIISSAGTIPEFFTPWFIKKFTYRQVMIFYQLSKALCYSVIVVSIITLGEHLTLCGTICLVMMFIMEMTKTIPTSFRKDMEVKVNDYQMYLSGERLEQFAGIFSWFTNPVTQMVSLIIPVLLLESGFNSNWDVLFLDSARIKIIVIPMLFDIVGYIVMTIPYFFWDFDSEKHGMVMQVLERRKEVTEGNAAQTVKEEAEV